MSKGINIVLRVIVLTLSITALAAPARAAIVQIGSFQGATGSYTYSAGTLSGTMTGDFNFDPAFVAIFGSLTTATYADATLTVSATRLAGAAGNVFSFGGSLFQRMDGYLEVRDSGGTLLIRADFTNGLLFGVSGSTIVKLEADQPAGGATIVYSSDVFNDADLVPPSAFTFTLNPISRPLSASGGNFRAFEGVDTANFSSTVETEVPEPATMTLLGLGAVSMFIRRRRSIN
jgi:PEP-CTERM motif